MNTSVEGEQMISDTTQAGLFVALHVLTSMYMAVFPQTEVSSEGVLAFASCWWSVLASFSLVFPNDLRVTK